MRKKLNLGLVVVTFIIIIFAMLFIFYKNAIKKPLKTSDKTMEIVVNEGEGLYGVLDKLSGEGKLNNLLAIKMYIKKNHINSEIKPGIYNVLKDTNLENLIKLLKNGGLNNKEIKVTVPEGFTVEDIGSKLEKLGLCSKDEFLKAVKNYPLPDYIKKNKNIRYPLEGFLFPDTYVINKDASAKDIIFIMISRFEEVLKEIENKLNITIPKDKIEEVITVASIIEKEARIDKDRPLIASVIYNRLKKDMPLQIDATVLYALGKHKDIVTLKDLEINSPYNTYKKKGIPIGPICNPGEPSIIAALKPETTEHLYYILTKDDSHYFTNNYNDFLKKKKELGY
ncbi:endolytic transglycosylase MltG [Clostridium fallax]|uniref:Endolytic murein transglycosylase n=1 Tax=Clostridium fallax TaxID=1533 RepID=A0A1M4X7K0_9CLOT|nr:endolytic transglycosylase MltG [Clostridium fallax]SHE89479.1 UPF0755 protein [Clostridium fallax]SQB07347.1 aminodeoxychorismate lyase [Clostridium fallax]